MTPYRPLTLSGYEPLSGGKMFFTGGGRKGQVEMVSLKYDESYYVNLHLELSFILYRVVRP